MKEGKIPSELLRKLVFDQIKVRHKDVILRPEIGEDCAAIEYGDYACVMSTDPITGAGKGIGTLAVHISCNDVATCGVRPVGLLMTIMAPLGTTEEDIQNVMTEASEAAAELEVEIIGGHTEITSAVNRMIISTTALGKVLKSKLVTSSGARPGDDVIMTKWAGLEGTAIIAADREQELMGKLTPEEIQQGKDFIKHISVVKEGILAGEHGVTAMHDVTEGGILGAAWELAESAGLGIEVFIDHIPLHPVTQKIAQIYNINPYRLISSGSMLIAAEEGQALVQRLKQNGIQAAVIGKITEKGRYIIENSKKSEMEPPGTDELFNI